LTLEAFLLHITRRTTQLVRLVFFLYDPKLNWFRIRSVERFGANDFKKIMTEANLCTLQKREALSVEQERYSWHINNYVKLHSSKVSQIWHFAEGVK